MELSGKNGSTTLCKPQIWFCHHFLGSVYSLGPESYAPRRRQSMRTPREQRQLHLQMGGVTCLKDGVWGRTASAVELVPVV